MDVDGPHAAKGEQASERFERETQKERGQINQSHRVNGVEWMFAMSSEPIQMFSAVMDGVKAPEEFEAMLQSMSPINKQVAQENYLDRLKPPWLRTDHRTERNGHDAIEPTAKELKDRQDASTPEKVLAEEEAEIGQPMRTKEWLLFSREGLLQRCEEDGEKEEAETGAENGERNQHRVKGYMSYICYIVTCAEECASLIARLRFEGYCGVCAWGKVWILGRFVRMRERSRQGVFSRPSLWQQNGNVLGMKDRGGF
jgi:hypothetical protein